jgi:hypothetical protein
MAFPLIPFAAGIAVGALAAYGYKDEELRGSAEKGVRWLSDALVGAYDRVAGAVGGVFGSAVVAAEGPAAAQPVAPLGAGAVPDEPASEQPTTPTA